MGQKEGSQPARGGKLAKPIEDRIKDGIKKKAKGLIMIMISKATTTNTTTPAKAVNLVIFPFNFPAFYFLQKGFLVIYRIHF